MAWLVQYCRRPVCLVRICGQEKTSFPPRELCDQKTSLQRSESSFSFLMTLFLPGRNSASFTPPDCFWASLALEGALLSCHGAYSWAPPSAGWRQPAVAFGCYQPHPGCRQGSPAQRVLHPLTSHLASGGVGGGLFRQCLSFDRQQENGFLAHTLEVLLLVWLQDCPFPALHEGCLAPTAIAGVMLASAAVWVTPGLQCLLHATRW